MFEGRRRKQRDRDRRHKVDAMNVIPEKMLWCEVIARAVVDCNHGSKQALRFFMEPEMYHEICEFLELSDSVVKRIRVDAIFGHCKKNVSKYSLLDVSKSSNRFVEQGE
jgi:hypothetical protein